MLLSCLVYPTFMRGWTSKMKPHFKLILLCSSEIKGTIDYCRLIFLPIDEYMCIYVGFMRFKSNVRWRESLCFLLVWKMRKLGFLNCIVVVFQNKLWVLFETCQYTPSITAIVFDLSIMSRFPNSGTYMFVVARAHKIPTRHLAPRWSLGPQCKLWR